MSIRYDCLFPFCADGGVGNLRPIVG